MSFHRIACAAAALALGACVPTEPPLAAPTPSVAPSPPPAPPSAAPAASAAATATAEATRPVATATAEAKPEPPPPPPLPPVELVEVPASLPSGPPPTLAIAAPTKNQVIPTQKVAAFEIKLSVKAAARPTSKATANADTRPTLKPWKLGEDGDHLCVVLDRTPCRRVDDLGRSLRLGELASFIDEGQHVLTVLAQRGSGEFVRPVGKSASVASLAFFVGKKVPPVQKDGSPMLFFSPPEGGPAPPEGVLIDFYVVNAEVAAGKYVVHATVGGPGIEQGVGIAIHAPQPMRLRNARPGEYLARLSLLQFASELGESRSFTTVTSTAQPVKGLFSEVTRSFQVTPGK